MEDQVDQRTATATLTPARVAASAMQQAARHERALQACLAELTGNDLPTPDIAVSVRARALRHANRAVNLAKTAIRIDRGSPTDAFFAALLERYERNALLVERWVAGRTEATVATAG